MHSPHAADPGRFSDLPLRAELQRVLSDLGFTEPTPIQRLAIPAMLAGTDVVGRAATGTGKTAAFALPIMQALTDASRPAAPVALVLVPTRELALQVSEAMATFGRGLGARVEAVYGGAPIGRQLRALSSGVDVVVATPGRAIDHLQRGSLSLDGLHTVVLDEADEMFERGFAEDIETILERTPAERQTVLFSATMPPRVDGMIRRHLRSPQRIDIESPVLAAGEAPKVTQKAFVVRRAARAAALGRILELESPGATLVFCRTRIDVDELTEQLNGRGYRAEALHGGLGQEARDRVMGRLRAGTAELLIATDVAARGLDVDVLTHVVNAELPSSPEIYTHRIGRVGRAGREGVAISLLDPRQHNQLQFIERVTGNRITIEALPTVGQLQAAQLGRTLEQLRTMLDDGGFDAVGGALDDLLDEHDPAKVAMAALQLAQDRLGDRVSTEDVEDLAPRLLRRRDAGERPARRERPERGPGAAKPSPGPNGMTRLFVGAGHNIGLRPQDLVGAITGEAGLRGNQVGAIDISERFTLVEVPTERADDVITALRSTTLKGTRATIRRERFAPPRSAAQRSERPMPSRKKPFNEATTRPRSAKHPKW
jgi:ATP-dependent RNA helicase DeaD